MTITNLNLQSSLNGVFTMEQVNDKTTKRQIHHHYKIKMFTDNYRIFTIQHKVKLS